MAYPIFILIGLLFDAIVLVASAGLVFLVFKPDMLGPLTAPLVKMLASNDGRIELFTVGAVFFILSFRGIFMLVAGRGAPDFVVKTSTGGTLTVSHSSIEQICRRLVQASKEGARLRTADATPAGAGVLNLRLRVELDMVANDIDDFARELETSVRAHFKDKIGLDIKSFNIKAEYAEQKSRFTAQGGK